MNLQLILDKHGKWLRGEEGGEIANLSGADLGCADLSRTPILSFTGGKHFAYSFNGLIKIGCIEMSVADWKIKVKAVGAEHDYTQEEIEMYTDFISICEKRSSK